MVQDLARRHGGEMLRYAFNGLLATAVHYAVLTYNLEVLRFASAGLANLCAAVAGIAVSFLGSRYFVFGHSGEALLGQALKFSGLYGLIAIVHGGVLLVWTDWLGLDYRLGFVLATALQIALSYLGNKFLVFKK
jgi:putative flippase GtrA